MTLSVPTEETGITATEDAYIDNKKQAASKPVLKFKLNCEELTKDMKDTGEPPALRMGCALILSAHPIFSTVASDT